MAREMTGSVLGAEQEVKIGGWLPMLYASNWVAGRLLSWRHGSAPVSPIERLEGIPALLDSVPYAPAAGVAELGKTWQPTKMWVQLNAPFFSRSR